MFDFVPFAGAGWVVTDDDLQPGHGGKSGEFEFPEPGAVAIGASTVGGDEDPLGIWISVLAHLLPPFIDGSDSEDRRVVIDTDRHPGAIIGQVVHTVWNGFAVSLAGEIIGGHLDWFTLPVPFFTGLGEPSDQFLFLGVDADHGVAAGQELSGTGTEVSELGVAVGVLALTQFSPASLTSARSVHPLRETGMVRCQRIVQSPDGRYVQAVGLTLGMAPPRLMTLDRSGAHALL